MEVTLQKEMGAEVKQQLQFIYSRLRSGVMIRRAN